MLWGSIDDASEPTVVSFAGHGTPWNGPADRSYLQLQRGIADLGDIRKQLVASTSVVLVLDTCFSGSNVNGSGGAWGASTRLNDPAQYAGGAASSFTAWSTTPNMGVSGAPVIFALPSAPNHTGVPFFGDVATPPRLSCEVLPNFEYFTAPEDICPPTSTLSPVSPASTPASPFSSQFANHTDDLVQLGLTLLKIHKLLRLTQPSRIRVTIDLDRLPEQRENLLLLLDGIRAALHLRLVLVLAALARRPDVRNLVLVLVAASRCYGHRSEPDDHLLPTHRSKPIVRGELVLVA